MQYSKNAHSDVPRLRTLLFVFEKLHTANKAFAIRRAYAAVEPCRRQRPERSEDAARKQAAEGRMAQGFVPIKNVDIIRITFVPLGLFFIRGSML